MIAQGKYRARAQSDSVSFGTSKNGNEQIAVTFDLLAEDDQPSGETITWIGTFSEKAMARTLESVENCGWNMSDGPTCVDRIADNVVELVVEHEEYQGRVSARVKWVNRIGARFAFEQPLDQRAKGSLFARIKAHSQGRPGTTIPSPAPAPRRAAPQRPTTTGEDTSVDDIPF